MYRSFTLTLPLALALVACAAPPRIQWMKEGATSADRDTAVSECRYQIQLNKTPATEQPALLELCMQGKGYRLRRV
jgi:hypothetical protein